MHDAGMFLKNYIEYIEEVPNEVQKCITKCREVDCKTKNLITEVEKISKSDRKSSVKMHQILVKITELKDEKIQLSQSLTSHIENKYKIVADSFETNDVVKQEKSPEREKTQVVPVNHNISIISNASKSQAPAVCIVSTNPIPTESQEKPPTKRIRKTRIDNLDVDSTDDNLIPPIKLPEKSIQSTSAANKRATAANAAKKTKKRKATKKQNAQAAQETLDEVIQDDNITDETTYCVCQQISYGEMIFCENDTCPIEWFHFSCVDLTAKPKGRWFCPSCRGDKQNVLNKSLRKKQQESSI